MVEGLAFAHCAWFPIVSRESKRAGGMRRQPFTSQDEQPSGHWLPFPKAFTAPGSLYSLFHLRVSKCVNKRVEHGDNNCVEECQHLVYW